MKGGICNNEFNKTSEVDDDKKVYRKNIRIWKYHCNDCKVMQKKDKRIEKHVHSIHEMLHFCGQILIDCSLTKLFICHNGGFHHWRGCRWGGGG